MAPWGPPERILAPLACLSFPRSAFSARSFQQNPCSVHGAAPPHQESPPTIRPHSQPLLAAKPFLAGPQTPCSPAPVFVISRALGPLSLVHSCGETSPEDAETQLP